MKDTDIRKILHLFLERENKLIKDTLILDELDLCSGLSRIDIAVINGVIHGYEIKSEEDSLSRLHNQMNYYNKSLEKITIATNLIHLNEVKERIPKWWGLILVDNTEAENLTDIRNAEENPHIDAQCLLQFLWKDELLQLAQKYNLNIKRSSNKRVLQVEITNELKLDIISQEVRQALKSRHNWRS
ncbi:MAG: sce7726 family protein [Ignavibacteriaceae bacterium]|jgi:hypothetical protein